jgi:hypothetical protein
VIYVLKDEQPCEHMYLISILTGWRCGGGTASNVMLQLQGTKGDTKVLAIPNRHGSMFQSGAEEWFAVGTRQSLGTVYRIFVGHDGCQSW